MVEGAPGEARAAEPLRRADYDKLVESGAFAGVRVELVRGAVVAVTPHSPPHDATLQRLTRILVRAVGDRADVRIASSYAASDDSEPEPDVAVVPRGDYDRAHPDRAWLVVEVSKSSLSRDRDVKAALYAESRVDEYWVVDIDGLTIEVYRMPRDGRFTERTVHGLGVVVRPLAFPDVEVLVADVLPPR